MNQDIIQQMVDGEINLALSNMSVKGYNTTIMLSNYNQIKQHYLLGVVSFEDFNQHLTKLKMIMLEMLKEEPPYTLPNYIVTRNPIVIVAHDNDVVIGSLFYEKLKDLGIVSLINGKQKFSSVSKDMTVVFIITKTLLRELNWSIHLIDSFVNKSIFVVVDPEVLNLDYYTDCIKQIQQQVYDIKNKLQEAINKGFPTGLLSNELIKLEDTIHRLDKDIHYLWMREDNIYVFKFELNYIINLLRDFIKK